jgi:hypothetical protein
MAWTTKYYLKNNYLTFRSKSNEGHYGMRHTALWTCTHIPNIIDLIKVVTYCSPLASVFCTLLDFNLLLWNHLANWNRAWYECSLNGFLQNLCYFKRGLFDLEVKGQGPTKVIMVCNTPPYGHAPTYQISLTYLKRKKLWSGQASLRSRRKPWPLTSRSNNCFFRDRSMIFGMCVHVHKAVCRIP